MSATEPLGVGWELELEDGGDTGSRQGPVYFDDTLFATAGNRLHAVSLDGTIKWTFAPGRGNNPGFPTVANGLVVAGALDDKVRAIDAETGELRWEITPPVAGHFRDPVAFDGERVYVVGDDGGFCCLAADDGAVVWSRPQDRRMSPPAAAGGRVYTTHLPVAGHRLVIALVAATGEQHWSSEIDVAWPLRPFVDAGEVICTTNHRYLDAGVAALDTDTGEVRWTADFYSQEMSPPVAAGGSVFIRTANHGVCSIERGSGKVNWWHTVAHDSEDYLPGPPVVSEGLVLCTLGYRTLQAIDAESGTPLWSRSVSVFSRPAVVDGTLFFLDGRRLCAIDLKEIHPIDVA